MTEQSSFLVRPARGELLRDLRESLLYYLALQPASCVSCGRRTLWSSGGAGWACAMYRRAFPDLTFTVDNLIAEGDLVSCAWSDRPTHLRELMGIPPTCQSGAAAVAAKASA